MSALSSRVPQPLPPSLFQQRRVDVLMALQKAAQDINSILDLDELLETIVHRIAVEFGCIESSILLVDGSDFTVAAVRGCTQSKKGDRWPVTDGLSGEVVASGKHYYAPDVTQELLYKACEPHTRSEVIFPLRVRDRVIGVFGASHHDVDAFPKAQIDILRALAGHIAIAVDNAQRIQRERQQVQKLHWEQEESRRIQQNLLPKSAPVVPGFTLEAACVPVGAVGGDWYDYIPLEDGRVAIVLADVSGKGMPAALMMSATRGIIRSLARVTSSPAEVLRRANEVLLSDFATGQYVTMIYAVLDSKAHTLTFASAGHPWPLLCHHADVRPLHTDAGMPLGLLPGDFSEHVVKLCCDFRLLFFTDGISEQIGHAEEEFGCERLMNFVGTHDCDVECLMGLINSFRGERPQTDDATVILLRSA